MAIFPIPYDVAIIGCGINGAGIACDAAGRGLSVILIEAAGPAGATSSASSKLIHGGLRYLEQMEFALVRKALAEREVLLAKAPHLLGPLRFLLPHAANLRPHWKVRLGLLLYDRLSRRRTLPGSGAVDLRKAAAGCVLKDSCRDGFAYWDCRVDDARLAILNACDAASRGAHVRTRTRFVGARVDGGIWELDLEDSATGAADRVRAKSIVNAAGPWAEAVTELVTPRIRRCDAHLRLVKGSHIVVRAVTEASDAFILQQPDARVVFLLPFEDEFSLIGTTDIPFAGDPGDAAASDAEIDYLLSAVNRYLVRPLTRQAVIWSFAGVRPLLDDDAPSASAATRDYRLVRAGGEGEPPFLSVFGGKITTYRRLAEEVLGALSSVFPTMGPAWTARSPLPGGDFPEGGMAAFRKDLLGTYDGIDAAILDGIARRHGTSAHVVLGSARTMAALGRHMGAGLYEREVAYLHDHEWARTADEILWTHTKTGLHLTQAERDRAAELIDEIL